MKFIRKVKLSPLSGSGIDSDFSSFSAENGRCTSISYTRAEYSCLKETTLHQYASKTINRHIPYGTKEEPYYGHII